MSDPRKELIRQMAALRQRLDPKVVEQAKMAVFGQVPFDRDNAKAAVGDFLDRRRDGGAFRRKLEEALRQEGGRLELDAAPGDDEPKGPQPPKPRRIGRIV